MKQFPRTMVGGVSLPRLLIGTNWMTGFSHTGPAADKLIRSRNGEPGAIAEILKVFLRHGVDAMMIANSKDENLWSAVKLAEDAVGRRMIVIDEPILNVDDTPQARQEARRTVQESARRGATFCLPMHVCVEELMNKNTRTMQRLPDYLAMIREAGMVPGLSAHMPEVIQFADENEYDVETYVQIFNCMGFLMQVEIESIARVIHAAKKPVMTIKPCAAGRTTPFVGLNFSWNVIRPQDMIAIGCMTPDEAEEDVEISLAALERRLPNIGSRSSPVVTSIISGKANDKK